MALMYSRRRGTQATVLFGSNDELSVLDRKGHVEPLQISSLIDQLDLCLVFLDKAPTRGNEPKLPRNYRAAVRLGANLKIVWFKVSCHGKVASEVRANLW